MASYGNMEQTEDIIEKRLASTIFLNKRTLYHTYVPEVLPHRHQQISDIVDILVDILRGYPPANIMIYGKPGTGKTVVAKHVSEEIRMAANKRKKEANIHYISCADANTTFKVLTTIARTLDIGKLPHSTSDYRTTIRDAVHEKSIVMMVILDEVDKLIKRSGDDALYYLSRLEGISLMGITNDIKIMDSSMVGADTKSSLLEREIIFPPYNADQLRDILEQRAEMAFKQGTLEPSTIPLCAAFAAKEHGDARKALDLLRVAGEIAENSGHATVTEEHVRQAEDKIEMDRVSAVVRDLPLHAKLVLYAILLCDGKDTTTGNIFKIYKRTCKQIGEHNLTQRSITDTISELNTLGIISADMVYRGKYGRTREIKSEVPVEQTKYKLLEDDDLKPLAGLAFNKQAKLVV